MKLSGKVTEAALGFWTVDDLRPYADTVLDAFGPDRLMFGSDWRVCTLAATYGKVFDSARELTTPAKYAQVFETAATRVYGLRPPEEFSYSVNGCPSTMPVCSRVPPLWVSTCSRKA